MPGELKHIVWPGAMTWATRAPIENAPIQAARKLVNFWPHEGWVELRGGYRDIWTLPSDGSMFLPADNIDDDEAFVATNDAIYRIDLVDENSTPSLEKSGFTSGDWSYLNTQTPGGSFFLIANGADPLHIYDGTNWRDTSTDPTLQITGVDPSKLSHIWAFKTRVFAIEKNTLNAWYSDAGAIAGTYHQFPLTSVFSKGGHLVAGTTVTIDAGSGLDDRCVFITSEGEIAIYEGTDPSDASQWRLVGVYSSSPLLHKRAIWKSGGDVWLFTRDGILSLFAIIKEGLPVAKAGNQVAPIQDQWRYLVTLPVWGTPWSINETPDHRFLTICPNTDEPGGFTLVLNIATGSLAEFRGWPLGDKIEKLGRLFCLNGTQIAEVNTTGKDGDTEFFGQICGSPQSGDDWRSKKLVQRIDARFQANAEVWPTLAVGVDGDCYDGGDTSQIGDFLNPDPIWDQAEWDVSYWGAAATIQQQRGAAYGVNGLSLMPWFSVRSNQSQRLRLRINSLSVWYREGSSL